MANRRLAGVLAAVAAMSLVAGCAFKTPTPAPKPTKDPVHIDFWTALAPDSQPGKTLIRLVNQFNSAQTDVMVTATYQGAYIDIDKRLTAAIAAGKPPAVVQATDSLVANFVSAKSVVALDGLVPASDFADYPPSFLSPLTIGGRHYALPFNRSVMVMFYNTRLVPQPPHTWAELQEVAADVAENTDAGIALSPDVYGFAPFFHQAGGQWLQDGEPAFAGAEGTEALQLMQDMVQDGSAALIPPKEYAINYLNDGRVGMIMATSASAPYLHSKDGDRIAAAPLPAGPAGAFTVGSGANVMIVEGITPAEQKAAAKFVLWLTGRDATLQFATTGSGYVPVRYSALADPVWQTYVKANPDFAAMSNAIDKTVAQPADARWSAVQTKITAAVQAALNDGDDPEEALAGAEAAARNLLRK
jgi:ABC-type glycerol-3-phosphate transport system substrate-binding protein